MISFLSKVLLLLAILGLSSAAVLPRGALNTRALGSPINLPKGKPISAGQTVAYFGQFGEPGEDSLSKFCSSSNIDIIVLAFVNVYRGAGGLPGMNLGRHCGKKIAGTDLLDCPDMGKEITACQAAGKKVLLSLGGETAGGNSLPDDKSATELGENLWKLFGEGKGLESKRPFGGAIIDGFDIGRSPFYNHCKARTRKSNTWSRQRKQRSPRLPKTNLHPPLVLQIQHQKVLHIRGPAMPHAGRITRRRSFQRRLPLHPTLQQPLLPTR